MKLRRCGHPWIGDRCKICKNASRKKKRDEKRGGLPSVNGRPPKRFCPAGHDKDLPNGSYWSDAFYRGKKFKKRQCALCHAEQCGVYRLNKKLRAEPKKAAEFRARALKEFCWRGHAMTPKNVYTTQLSGGRTKRECRACRQHRKDEYQLESAAVLRAVEKILSMPPQRIHASDPFERRNAV